MGTIASDSFDGTEGTEISTYDSSWTLHTSYSYNAEIANNRARCSTNSATTCYWHNASPASADYEVTAKVKFVTFVTNDQAGVCGRITTSANSMYYARYAWNGATKNVQLYKITTGTSSLLGSTTHTYVTGDEKSITLKMNGSTIELWMDGSSSYDVQATDSTHTGAGKAGFRMYTPAASDSAANHINDWALMEADAGGQPYRKRLGGVGFAAHNAGVW